MTLRTDPPATDPIRTDPPATHPLATGPVRTALSAADVVAAAEGLAPRLLEEQAATEARTFYSEEVHARFVDAGLYRILVPERFGGLSLGVDTFVSVSKTLARACPSTGWMYLFGAVHALAVGTLFPEEVQAELFGDGHFICPATVAPTGTAQRTADGDWLVSGRWGYCSGSPYATHYLGHVMATDGGGPPAPMLFVAPRASWTRLDDWGGQLGLRGSGSHSIVMDGARIPDRWTVKSHLSQLSVADSAPGRALHGPQYGGGPLSLMLLELAVMAVGMAQGAVDAYEDLMRSRTTSFLPIVPRTQDPDFQFRYGQSVGMVAAADAALTQAVRQWLELCDAGPQAFTREAELRLAMIGREAVRLCWGAVETHLFPTAGSSSVKHGERLERVWRDMSMMHSHAGLGTFLSTLANRELAVAVFGAGSTA